MNRRWLLLLFCAVHVVIFLVVFDNGLLYGHYLKFDYGPLFRYGSKVINGFVPYRDFAVEYPPLALLFMALPSLFASDASSFGHALTVEILLFDLLGMLLVAAMSKRLAIPLWKSLGVYTLSLLAIGPIITVRYDLVAAVTVLLALYAFVCGRNKTCWALLAAGTMIKLFPAVVAPVLLIYQLRHRQHGQAAKGVAVFLITCAVIALPFLVLSPGGLVNSFIYHIGRGLQIESTYASFLLLARALGFTSLQFSFDAGATNVVSTLASVLAAASIAIALLSLLAVFYLYHRKQTATNIEPEERTLIVPRQIGYLVNYSLLAIVVFVVTSKVFSTQFIAWLFPLVPLVTGRWQRSSWMLFMFAGLATFVVYPKYYSDLADGSLVVTAVLFLRNVSLVGLALMLARGDVEQEGRSLPG